MWSMEPNNGKKSSIKKIENFPLDLSTRKPIVILMRMNF